MDICIDIGCIIYIIYAIHVLTVYPYPYNVHPGISLKSQILFLTVYATRYLDVLLIFHIHTLIQFYNLLMKIFFITTQTMILHSMLVKYRATYNPKLDNFRIEWVVVPCLVLAIFLQQSHGRGVFGLIREVRNKHG